MSSLKGRNDSVVLEERILLQLLDSPYRRHKHASLADERLTVVAFVYTPEGQLLFVLPSRAKKHGWIPPQGGVEEGQTLRAAVAAELREECRYGIHRLGNEMKLLGHWRSDNGRGGVKRLVGVFVPLLSWQEPKTNYENRKWCLAGSWDEVAKLMKDGSDNKRLAVNHFLGAAAVRVPRFKKKWGVPTVPFRLAMQAEAVAA
ncbi:NUDIX hydrolase [Patescibacteria group bacterium]|nr:NUDIX hydrolase [Patescibacteria group bacterium]